MKISNYAFCIKLNLLLLIIFTIECIRLSSNSEVSSKEKSTLKTKLKISSESATSTKSNLNNKKSTFTTNTKSLTTNKNKNSLMNTLKKSGTQITSSFSTNSKSKTLLSSKLTTSGCNPLCSQCSYSDKNYCTVCKTGVILFSFSCVESCPLGTYLNQEAGSCSSCHQECPICWGPESNNCGTIFGVKAQVVNLESEIVDYFRNHIFIKDEVDQWISALKSIFRDPKDEIIYPLFAEENPEFSVYLDEKGNVETPIGTFGFAEGLFVPVPPYINREKKLVESHWIYKKGTWDGSSWHEEYYPRLPTFIQYKGSKDKIYLENNGMWIFDITSQWIYIKSVGSIMSDELVFEKLNFLNKIKFDVKE